MPWDHPELAEDWLNEVALDLPPNLILELLEQCIAELEGDGPTYH